MNNISTFWGFVLKVHSFASPESDTDIIRNVALTGTSGRMYCGMIQSRNYSVQYSYCIYVPNMIKIRIFEEGLSQNEYLCYE